MKKETVSRFNEVVFTTSDLTALKGKYLTEKSLSPLGRKIY